MANPPTPCIGDHGSPAPGLICEACEHQALCRSVIKRSKLRPIVAKLEKVLAATAK